MYISMFSKEHFVSHIKFNNMVNIDWDRVNLDLIVPFVMIFVIMRIDMQQILLHGLRYFVAAADRVYFLKPLVPKTKLHVDAAAVLEKSIQYSLLEIDSSFQKKHLVSSQPFFTFYKTLVMVTTSVIAIHCWYVTYHCFNPSAPHISWSIFLAVASMLLAIQSQWNILLLTGWRAFESKVALNFGIMSCVACCVALFMFNDLLGFNIPFIFDGMSIHFNVLLLQLSANPLQLNQSVLSKVLRIVVSILFGCITAALVVPVLRYTQIFIAMQFGVDRAVTSILMSLMLWVDMLGPFILATVLCPLFWSTLTHVPGMPVSISAPHIIRTVQLSIAVWISVNRLMIMKPLLQSMLDTTVRMVLTVVKLGNVNKETKPLLQEKLKVVGGYLAAGASQLLAFPALVISACILIQRLTPGGTGICLLARNAAGLDPSPILQSTSEALLFDATATAREQAVAPFFDQALHAFLMDSGLGGHSPSAYMMHFISRASFLHVIPPGIAMDLLVMLLAFACFAQGLLYVLAVFYWRRALVTPTTTGDSADDSADATTGSAEEASDSQKKPIKSMEQKKSD